MLTASVESFIDNIPQLKEIIGQHWDKLGLYKDKMPLAPEWGVYCEYERQGVISFVVLRDSGRMVGYWITFIAPGLHYSKTLTATMDIWNVLPEYENSPRAILCLSKAADKELKRRGVNISRVGEKNHTPCEKLYKALGYEPVETIYQKWIQD